MWDVLFRTMILKIDIVLNEHRPIKMEHKLTPSCGNLKQPREKARVI